MLFRKAVLVVHGFAGGIYDEQSIIDELQLSRVLDVFSYTLPGHERNFSKVSYEEWIAFSEKKVEWLISKGYSTIYILGHSMGGVISCHLACKYPQIKKIVLAAPAFYYLKSDETNTNVIESVKDFPKILKTYGFQEIFDKALKLNIGAVSELRKLVTKYHSTPQNIKVPIMILQGSNDSIVPDKSSLYVYENVKSNVRRLVLIDGATHDIFRDKKCDEINKLIKDFLLHPKRGKKVIEI